MATLPAIPTALPSPTNANSLPNQVPLSPRSIRYRDAYPLTQLGVSMQVPLAKLVDESDPESGFGVKPGGSQGFMTYCKDIEVMESLPALPADIKVMKRYSNSMNKGLSHSVSSGRTSPSLPMIRSESVPEHSSARQSSPLPRDKIFPFRGSTNEKLTNRKSTPEFDRKSPASNEGTMKKKSKLKKKSDNDRMQRKEEKRRRAHGPPIIIKVIDDFPEEALKLIRKTKIPDQQFLDNLRIIVHIIRFRTGYNVRTEDEVIRVPTLERIIQESDDGTGSRPLTDSLDVEMVNSGRSADPGSGQVDPNRQKEIDIDSDVLDPSIIPRGGEDLLSDPGDIKKTYKNLQHAGRGGFGSVYVAKSPQDKCDIAIKKLPHITKKMKRTNFNEIGFLNSCKHSNIVKYYRSHLIEEEIWVVMEYMQGGTLAEAVERYSFAETSVAYVAREMLKALEYLHGHNLVHRDLKSANVMLTVEGKIKLIDFGLCVDFTQRRLCHMAGSPFWMPPEMIIGIPHGTPSDMWSFAICLLELANGEPPNRKSPVKAMFLAATEGITLPPEKTYSPEFVDFLYRCLQIDQSKRATATELLRHPFLNKADTQDTMRKILAQIFISNAISNLDYGL